MTEATIIVVEDEMIVMLDLQRRLRRLGYRVVATAMSGEEAIRLSGQLHPNLVLMDIGLRGPMDGIEAAQRIQAQFGIPIVFLTAYTDARTRQQAEAVSPAAFLGKPIEDYQLQTAIEAGIRAQR